MRCIQFLVLIYFLLSGSFASSQTYLYDGLDRLVAVDYGNGKTIVYTYDAAGNMLTVVKNGLQPQTITPGAAPTVKVGGTGTVSATVSSPLTVTFSVTPSNGVCSLAGVVVSGISQGTCTVYADQAGDATYSPAPTATIAFSILPANITQPTPPTITSFTPGPGKATFNFTPPTNSGGAPIASYTASCSATGQTTKTATGSGSPITVSGLKPNVSYSCALTASNGTYSSSASAATTVTVTKGPDITPILMLLLD